MSKWRNWDDYIPFSYDGWKDLELKREWYATHIPLLNQFFSEFASAMQASGFTVSITNDNRAGNEAFGGGLIGWAVEGQAEKDGFPFIWSLGPMTPRDYTPDEYAAYVQNNYRFERAMAMQNANTLGTVTNQTQYQQTQQNYIAPHTSPQTSIPPAQTPVTVSVPQTIQPVQAPNTPDTGTQVTPSGNDPQLRTFDEWNYLYRQETGRIPPSPEAVGYTKPRETKITKGEWESYVFSQSGNQESGNSGGSNPRIPDSTVKLFSLFEIILSFFGLIRKRVVG